MSTEREYANKENEPTVTLFDRRQDPSSILRTNFRSDNRHSEPWYRSLHLGKPAPSQIRPFEQRESAEAEVRSAQFSSQSLQDNSSDRPSKRRRGEQYGPLSPLSSPSRTSPSDRLALSTRRTSAVLAPLNDSGIRYDGPQPKVLLLDSDLWAKFNEHQNEMIITTSGRCLFPSLRFNAFNLNPDAYYSFRLEFEMLAPNRFRFSNGAWKAVEPPKHIDDSSAAIATAASGHKGETYTHPDRLKLGSHWMASSISFDKAKLANKTKSR
ncbi:T-box transcription factor tbx19, partial [Mortierella hygrophila]